MSKELEAIAAGTGNTVYAIIRQPRTGKYWNGTSYENYTTANRSDYAIALTEEGSTGDFSGDFPSGITASGTYEYKTYIQAGTSPADSDQFANAGTVDWTGTGEASGDSSGGMTGSDFYDYLLRCGFKRTDKETEVYEAITDTIADLRIRFDFDEAQQDSTSTDTIDTIGDYRISLESTTALLLGVIMQDGLIATPLTQISKAKFDAFYPDIANGQWTGYPRHFCVHAGSIYIGPVPELTSYVYRLSWSARGGTVTSSTSSVPFTGLSRETVKDGAYFRLYNGLEMSDAAAQFKALYEAGCERLKARDRQIRGAGFFRTTPLPM